jgi:hypothetical protein
MACHSHDDLLEDVSRQGIDSEAHALSGYLRRLDEINLEALTRTERLEHRMLTAHLQGRMFELEAVRTWERNPQFYSDLLATSLAGQTLFAHASAPERARRVLSKLRQTPRVIQAARDNIKDPPGIYVKVGIETMRGALKFIDEDLPRAFKDVDDLHLLGDLADAQAEASQAVGSYVAVPRDRSSRRKRARSFRLGRDKFEQKLRLEEGISLPSTAARDRHARAAGDAGSLPLARRPHERRRSAGGVGEDEGAAPAPGELVRVGREQLDELATFLERQSIITIPQASRHRRADARLLSLVVRQHVDAGPVRDQADARLLLPHRRRSVVAAERQDEHLRDYNFPTLWSISIHEVYPGHFLHYQHLRRVESKARKSILFAPASFVEGWAHYCEQMMMEAGFGRQDHSIKLGQLAEALIRLVRFIVCIRLHAEDMSVEQGVRYFREEAFMEESSARREAERGAFDPTYLVYTVGKLMLLKLRQDVKAQQGKAFSLRTFHDTLLSQGTAPFWLHRQLMLGDDSGDLLE